MKKIKLFATNAHLFEKINNNNNKTEIIKKALEIYKTPKHYTIITMYRTLSGTYLSGEPVFILPLDVTMEEVSKVILKGLDCSCLISELEENTIWNNRKHLLKEINELSFNALYKKSKSCIIYYIKNKEITIEPQIYCGFNKGTITDTTRVVKMEFSESKKINIIQVVIDMLSKL